MSFSDPPVKFEKSDVDRVLAQAQQQDALLVRLEKEMERNKEYLTKVCSLTCELPSLRHRWYFLLGHVALDFLGWIWPVADDCFCF